MDIAELIVPRWYLDARKLGATADDLRERVHNMCLTGATRAAEEKGETPPERIEEQVIRFTIELYESAITSSQNAA